MFKETKSTTVTVGLLGFGRVGKVVAAVILKDPSFSLEWVLRKKETLAYQSAADVLNIPVEDKSTIYSSLHTHMDELLDKSPVDFIIDFSTSSFIRTYGKIAADHGVKIISAISHYKTAEINLLKTLANRTAIFWSPNITLGVNYLIFAAKMFKKIAPWADIEIIEEHFKQKRNVSGTALKIANALTIDRDKINSVRVGGVVGKHEVIFGLPNQTVRVTHESISTAAFGQGALLVAENLLHKSIGFYTFEDILFPLFSKTLRNTSTQEVLNMPVSKN